MLQAGGGGGRFEGNGDMALPAESASAGKWLGWAGNTPSPPAPRPPPGPEEPSSFSADGRGAGLGDVQGMPGPHTVRTLFTLRHGCSGDGLSGLLVRKERVSVPRTRGLGRRGRPGEGVTLASHTLGPCLLLLLFALWLRFAFSFGVWHVVIFTQQIFAPRYTEKARRLFQTSCFYLTFSSTWINIRGIFLCLWDFCKSSKSDEHAVSPSPCWKPRNALYERVT